MNIIYTGSDPITVSGNIRIRANIVSLQGSIKAIDISIGGNVIMSGHIICGGDEIKLHGVFEADKTMIYAPLALVEVKGSAASNDDEYHITGAIVANHFNATAYFNIEYAAITRASLPLWFDAEDSGGNLGRRNANWYRRVLSQQLRVHTLVEVASNRLFCENSKQRPDRNVRPYLL